MGFILLAAFILIFPEGLTALTLQPSTNPLPVNTNVTISLVNPPVISFGAWLFGSSVLFMWSSGVIVKGSGYTNGITLNSTSYALTLSSVNLNNSGLYVVELMGNNTDKGEVFLDVQEPISGVSANVSKTNLVEFNDSVTFTCSGRGTPMRISWQNSSSLVTAGERITLGENGKVLTINPVTRYDQGPFMCHVANNISTGQSMQMNLTISYGPSNLKLTVTPQSTAYASGTVVALSCSADSKPSASIFWTHNDVPLSVNGSNLLLTNITVDKTGRYACVAYNAETLRYAAMSIFVRIIDPITEVMVNPQAGYPIESMSFNLTCNIMGSVGLHLWMKNNAYLVANNRITLSNQNSTLTINQLNINDNGQYKCVASNDVSNMTSLVYNLMVNYGPRNVEVSGPSLTAVGSSVTLNCSADSYPQSQYNWYFNGSRVWDKSVYITGALLVNNSGEYTCLAMNNITGQTRNASLALTVVAPVTKVTVNVDNQQLILNQLFSLTCNIVGDVYSIHWMKNDVNLSPNNRTIFSNNNLTLTLNQLTLDDDGLYRCAAGNTVSNMTSLAYNLKVNYGPWNTIIVGPTVGIAGYNVSYTCLADSHPSGQYSWFYNGSKIADGSVYLISPVTGNNRGHYSCVAYNNMTGISSNATVDLTVLNPISTVWLNVSNQQPVFDESFTLTCNVIGDVSSTQWMKNSQFINPNNRTTFSNENLKLTLNQLALNDGGLYQCVAHNTFNNMTSIAYNLTVNYGPWNTTISGPTAAAGGSSVTYICSANSLPSSQYSWFHNSSRVADGSVYMINNLQKINEGQYTCMVYNNITKISSNTTVDLTVFNIISSVTVNINQQPVFDHPLTLTCNINGDVSSIYWIKNGMHIAPDNKTTFSSYNATMMINELTLNDEGHYQCEAYNPVSNRTSVPYTLVVNYGPWNTSIIGPTNAEMGTSVTFNCSALSYPDVQYTWFLNGKSVANSSVYVIHSVTLNNTGCYTCSAFNSITGNRNNATLDMTVYVGISSVHVSPTPSIPEVGENLQLMCHVTGPYNIIHWLKNNQTLQPSDTITITKSNTTVNFLPLRSTNNGNYQCVAKNAFRSHKSEPFSLVATYGPVNVQIMIKPGYMTTLTCKAESQPPAVYYWVIENNNTIVAHHSSIEVSYHNVLGYNFTCVARNPLTNLTVYTSHFISDSGASVPSGIMLTILAALLLSVLNQLM